MPPQQRRKHLPARTRAAVLTRDRYRCVDCRRRFPDDELEVDHVQEVADNGAEHMANYATRCKDCHQRKTTRSARARRGGAVVDSTWRWGALRVPVGLGVIGYGAATLGPDRYARWAAPGAIGYLLALAAVVAVARVRARRRGLVLRLHEAIARETHMPPTARSVRVTRWRAGAPVEFTVAYSHLFADHDEARRAAVEAIARRKTGLDLHASWEPHADRVHFAEGTPELDEPAAEPAPKPDRVLARVEEALRAVVRGDLAVKAAEADAVGPKVLTVGYPSTFRDDSDDQRAAFVAVVNAKAPGRWRAEWDTGNDRVTLVRRPPMPKVVPHPVPGDRDAYALPLGLDEHGETVHWRLKVAPHMLVAGETGSGKSVLIRGVVTEAAARGFEVRICDPKRIEMRGLRGWPGVREVATDEADMIALVEDAEAEMRRRYRRIEEDGIDPASLTPVLLVIDEAAEWIGLANHVWTSGEKQRMKGTGSEHPVIAQWRSIARLGRSARVHLLVGIQRPDAKVFGGEARDNYGARVALGSLSPEGARMMFGATDVGRDVPADAKGRATVDLGGGPGEVQTYWTPEPLGELSDADRGILDGLRPAACADR